MDGDGWHREAVVRVYRQWDGDAAEAVGRAWSVLAAVSAVLDLAPRPLLADPAGDLIGEPLVVMSRLPGRPLLPTRMDPAWSTEFARALARVHGIAAERMPRGFRDDGSVADRLARIVAQGGEVRDPLWDLIVEAIAPVAERIASDRRTLTHADFWSGNTLWEHGRLTGIVDWSGARIGDPAQDVAYARGDLNIVLGPEAADDLVERYRALAGPVNELALWDLLTSLPAVRWLPDWIPGYHELGLTQVTLERARGRLEAFVEAAIGRLRVEHAAR